MLIPVFKIIFGKLIGLDYVSKEKKDAAAKFALKMAKKGARAVELGMESAVESAVDSAIDKAKGLG